MTQNAAARNVELELHSGREAHPRRRSRITVTDAEGDTAQQSFGLLVLNVAPTGTFNVPASCNQGDAVTVSFTNVTDPSSVDTAAGFSYFYDFGDGNGFVPGAATQAVPAAVVASSGTVNILGRVVDQAGAYTQYSGVLTVNDVAAKITSLAVTPTQFGFGQLVTVTGTFGVDPGVNDTHTVKIAWGDSPEPRTLLSRRDNACGHRGGNRLQQRFRRPGYRRQRDGDDRANCDFERGNHGPANLESGTGYQPGDVLTVNRGGVVGNAKLLLVGMLMKRRGRSPRSIATTAATVSNPVSITVTVADNGGAQDQKSLTADRQGRSHGSPGAIRPRSATVRP